MRAPKTNISVEYQWKFPRTEMFIQIRFGDNLISTISEN